MAKKAMPKVKLSVRVRSGLLKISLHLMNRGGLVRVNRTSRGLEKIHKCTSARWLIAATKSSEPTFFEKNEKMIRL